MGFFSKIWKGIKKGFKAVFKPIKKVFKSFGKFMNKLGIAGQIAMMFIPIPGLGALFSGLGNLGRKALGFMTKFGAVGKGAATLLGSAAKFAGAIAKPFINVTKAVKGFFENVTRYVGSKIPGVSGLFDPSKTPTGIFGGTDSAWSRASVAIKDSFTDFKGDIASAASMDISDLLPMDAGVDAAGNKIMNYKGYDSPISDKNLEKTFGADSDPYGDAALKDIEDLELPTGKTSDAFVDKGAVPIPSEITLPTTIDTEPDPSLDIRVKSDWTKLGEDPVGYATETGKTYLKNQFSPTSLLSKVLQSPPEMPEMRKASMYIDPVDPYKYQGIGSSMTSAESAWNSSVYFSGGQEEVQANMGFGGAENSAYNAYMTEFTRLPIMEKGLSSGWDMEPIRPPRQRAYTAGL